MKWTALILPLFTLISKIVDKFNNAKTEKMAASKISMPTTDLEIALKYIFQYVGKFYKWGGDDPDGFDCSGLAIEFLKAMGVLPRKYDNTAQGLWIRFDKCRVSKPKRGCLVFWENEQGKAIHVEVMLNERLALGASGGGSKTLTTEDAMRDNAFIKVRDIYSRDGIKGYIDPTLAK